MYLKNKICTTTNLSNIYKFDNIGSKESAINNFDLYCIFQDQHSRYFIAIFYLGIDILLQP